MRKDKLVDLKPYSYSETLDELNGPLTGRIKLPIDIFWAPGDNALSLDADDTLIQAYQAILSEGDESQISELINKHNLIRIWPRLSLPIPVAKGWESRFAELRGNMRASW